MAVKVRKTVAAKKGVVTKKAVAAKKPVVAKKSSTMKKAVVAKKLTPVKKAVVAKKGGSKSVAAKGDVFSCTECGLVVSVDETCGRMDVFDILCCGEPMKIKKSRSAKK